MNSTIKKQKKILEGTVVSNKMDKTVVVRVDSRIKHPLYGKTITRSKKFKAHDEKNECMEGDFVRIIECRPLSKDKSFRLFSIVKKGVSSVGDDLDVSVNKILVKEKKEEPQVEQVELESTSTTE